VSSSSLSHEDGVAPFPLQPPRICRPPVAFDRHRRGRSAPPVQPGDPGASTRPHGPHGGRALSGVLLTSPGSDLRPYRRAGHERDGGTRDTRCGTPGRICSQP